eukprot:scaffold647825_cov40-Prasinocladus_malaysianus.AAC.2
MNLSKFNWYPVIARASSLKVDEVTTELCDSRGLDIASAHVSATGCNPSMFWAKLHKGQQVQLKESEAHELMDVFLTIRDHHGEPYMSQEVDLGEIHPFLDDVLAKDQEKTGLETVKKVNSNDSQMHQISNHRQTSASASIDTSQQSMADKEMVTVSQQPSGVMIGGISLDRFLAFFVSTMMWLNGKAAPRVRANYAEHATNGKLDYDSFRKGLMTMIAWNEASNIVYAVGMQKTLFKHALALEEDPNATLVQVETAVKATYEMHDVVTFVSAS